MKVNKEGSRIAQVTFSARENGDWKKISSDALFKGKTVVVFSLPGAFTPTCSSTHLPRYEELASVFRENGVDEILCISVNDAFVMEAWGKEQGVSAVKLIPDGNGSFTESIGMLVDKSEIGFGKRSWRYSMLVKDGKIEKMFIEDEVPGDPFKVSDADTMLNYINPKAKKPQEVTIFSKPGCQFCLNAKKLLKEKGLNYEEILMGSGVSYKTLRNVTGKSTAPQIYIDGKHIDGYDGLKKYFESK